MVFEISYYFFTECVALLSAERQEQTLLQRTFQKDLHSLEIAPGERRYAFEAGPEAQGSGEFQQEAQRIVGEMPLQGIQGKNAAFRPFEKTVFVHPVADCPHQDFRHKKGHTVFLQIAPDAVERGAGGKFMGGPEL